MKRENITCTRMKYGEFPNLLFGTSADGIDYFDATYYIQNNGDADRHTVVDFKIQFAFWIKTMCNVYELNAGSVILMNEQGHYLIDESLALIMITYVEPDFGAYMLERITEMLINGIVISDTRLMLIVKGRLTDEQLTKLLEHDGKSF